MIRIAILVIVCLMVYYVIEHSYFIARTGTVLTVLAILGVSLYVLSGLRRL